MGLLGGLFGGNSSSSKSNVTTTTTNKNLGLNDVDNSLVLNEVSNVVLTDSGSTARSIFGISDVANNAINNLTDTTYASYDYGESLFDRASDSGETYFNSALDFSSYLAKESLSQNERIANAGFQIAKDANEKIFENATSESTRVISKFITLLMLTAGVGAVVYLGTK